MRKKELKLVVTFHTTTDAMAMEKACKEAGAPGRLIPVPREISAGCGLSWCAGIEDRDTIRKVIESIGVQEQEMHELMVRDQMVSNRFFIIHLQMHPVHVATGHHSFLSERISLLRVTSRTAVRARTWHRYPSDL